MVGGSPDSRGACPESKCGSPHRECESRSLRQRWKKSGTDEDTALKCPCGRPLCRFDLSWVRFPLLPPFSILRSFAMLPMKILWPIRARSVNGRSRRGDITWCRAAKAEPRSCRHAIPARTSSIRPGRIMNCATRSIRSRRSGAIPASRSSSVGFTSNRKEPFFGLVATGTEPVSHTSKCRVHSEECRMKAA